MKRKLSRYNYYLLDKSLNFNGRDAYLSVNKALSRLREIFGSRIITDEDSLKPYMEDESYLKAKPIAAIMPQNTLEVERIVKIAVKYKIPLTARGAGTSLSGGAVPVENGIVIDFKRMNRILKVYPEDMQVLVEPGTVYDELNAYLAKYNLFLPPNPSTGDQCTIGGMVAENAAGPRSFKYGTMRNWVLGLEVITSSIGKIWIGSRTRKWVSGYDLVRLFVGSEGTLGLITKILLKLAPLPEKRIGIIIPFNDIEEAGRAIVSLAKSRVNISALEIIDEITIDAINKVHKAGFPLTKAAILIEVEGSTDKIDLELEKIAEIIRKFKVEKPGPQVFFNANEMWSKRKLAGESLETIYGGRVDEDVVVPISKLPSLIKEIKQISEKHEVKIAIFGHAGDGHLHPCILVEKRMAWKPEIEKVKEEIFKAAVKLEGSLSGEHGIGLAKKPYLYLEHSEKTLRAFKIIKEALDPYNIMNPGKKII